MAENLTPQLMQPVETDDERIGYRPLSRAALWGLIVGLASPVALASPVFWIVPIVAITLSVWALLAIRNSDKLVSGHLAALMGIFLGATFLFAGPARIIAHGELVRREARQTIESWLHLLLAEKKLEAFQWTSEPAVRSIGEEIELRAQMENNPEGQKLLDDFLGHQAVQRLLESGEGTKITYSGVADQYSEDMTDFVVLRYEIQPAKATRQPFIVEVPARRRMNRTNRDHWWSIPEPPRLMAND